MFFVMLPTKSINAKNVEYFFLKPNGFIDSMLCSALADPEGGVAGVATTPLIFKKKEGSSA